MICHTVYLRVRLATAHTDGHPGYPGLARLVQESLKRDPHVGDLSAFRGHRRNLIKIVGIAAHRWMVDSSS
ncbi:IS66 family insertion sequence element accessory protein TnpB [Bradyrhizobium sp. I1.7.5]|uniref:IS66 family insertion sequence element accessory protein TnpB n=1 Tax=Bradyrhizobium sp. I1.7.5 TaxID=3156363 RepID=UPI003394736E